MVIKRSISTLFCITLLMGQSALAGPKDRLLPWFISSLATSAGAVGYIIGQSAEQVAPEVTQQTFESIASDVGQQGPSLISQAASATLDAAKTIAPSLLSKQGISVAAGLAATSAAWYGWRNRDAILENGKNIVENNKLLRNLKSVIEEQFKAINQKIDSLISNTSQINDRVARLEQLAQQNGQNIGALTAIARENNSLLHTLSDRIPSGWLAQLGSYFSSPASTNPTES